MKKTLKKIAVTAGVVGGLALVVSILGIGYRQERIYKTNSNALGEKPARDYVVEEIKGYRRFIPRPKFKKEMFEGESAEATLFVKKNYLYEGLIDFSNDGKKDTISVYADGVPKLTFETEDNSNSGKGWYEHKYSPKFSFTTSGHFVKLKVHIDSADKYGTSPNWFLVTPVRELSKEELMDKK